MMMPALLKLTVCRIRILAGSFLSPLRQPLESVQFSKLRLILNTN
ncbi:hypothetical protein RESH_05241 [Rhodopirellula europaea SH398]|uniref:Uncharacterized protein n=1 Tax=Rhodopirellula europaea SH398 TaxID=1263868 RepID=M5RY79_9BACT|nr:hypothetical protein RESH_05241 [Rhodopirellula europaea SH398]